jgi:hypothetical protein
MVLQVVQDVTGAMDAMDVMDVQEQLVLLVPPDHRVVQEQPALLDLSAQLVAKVPKVLKVLLALSGLKVLLEHQVQ